MYEHCIGWYFILIISMLVSCAVRAPASFGGGGRGGEGAKKKREKMCTAKICHINFGLILIHLSLFHGKWGGGGCEENIFVGEIGQFSPMTFDRCKFQRIHLSIRYSFPLLQQKIICVYYFVSVFRK